MPSDVGRGPVTIHTDGCRIDRKSRASWQPEDGPRSLNVILESQESKDAGQSLQHPNLHCWQEEESLGRRVYLTDSDSDLKTERSVLVIIDELFKMKGLGAE